MLKCIFVLVWTVHYYSVSLCPLSDAIPPYPLSPSFLSPSLSLSLSPLSQGMEYLHSRGISHGRLTTTAIHIHNRVCIQFRPQVKLPRHISCDELVSLPPEDMRALYLINGNLVLPNSPSLKPDVFAFG